MPAKDRPPPKRRNGTKSGIPTKVSAKPFLKPRRAPEGVTADNYNGSHETRFGGPRSPVPLGHPDNPIQINIKKDTFFLPVYHWTINHTADISFFYGGRDSGKSRQIAMQLVMTCLTAQYFRCVLVRKVFNTLKESCWQTIKDVAEYMKVDQYFTFTANPLQITCNLNGNRFICRGLDEPGNLKSIANPSHCWGEEMNQFNLDDFILLMTSLRYNGGKVQSYFSFNPEVPGDYREHFIYKIFYSGKDIYASFEAKWSIKVDEEIFEYTYISTWSTYKDNRFCTAERRAFLEELKNIDPFYYNVFTLGRWGNRKVTDPYCYAYDPQKHKGIVIPDRRREMLLSFDFNVNPITVVAAQNHGGSAWQPKIRGVAALKLHNSNIYDLCDAIVAKFPRYQFIVTGDASGKNTNAMVRDGLNYFMVIGQKLQLGPMQIKVPSVNPSITENRVLVNTIFHQCDVIVDEEGCRDLLFDFSNVSVNDLGKIDKGDRANPVKRADFLDCWRYLLNTFFPQVLKNIT